MATINYTIKSKKNPASLYIRLTHTKSIDCTICTGLQINPKHWDSKNKRFRKLLELPNHEQLNDKLTSLSANIINQFNVSYIEGKKIDKEWFSTVVKNYFNRPIEEITKNLEKIYLSDFAEYWLNNYAATYKVSASKYINERTITHYNRLNELIKEFEGKSKIKLKDIDTNLLDSFSDFLTYQKVFAQETTSRLLRRLKFFCERAEELNFEVNKGYKSRVFVSEENKKDYKEPYLSPEEIERIFNLSYEDDIMESTKDNLIISCWTGLRISDFMHTLTDENIDSDFIHIPRTKKTGTAVSIPLHPMIKQILTKRNGQLPTRISDAKYNLKIKEIATDAGITQIIKGGLIDTFQISEDEKISRKVHGEFPKNKLVTSHIGRRSFATNLFGQIDNSVIMAVGGWKTEKIMLDYVKKTNFEKAKELKEFWDKK